MQQLLFVRKTGLQKDRATGPKKWKKTFSC
jgi:hypothetical protein